MPYLGQLGGWCSEVLAQICLAYSIVKKKAINWWDIVGADANGEPQLDSSGRAIPKQGWYASSMSRLIKLPPGKSLGNQKSFRSIKGISENLYKRFRSKLFSIEIPWSSPKSLRFGSVSLL